MPAELPADRWLDHPESANKHHWLHAMYEYAFSDLNEEDGDEADDFGDSDLGDAVAGSEAEKSKKAKDVATGSGVEKGEDVEDLVAAAGSDDQQPYAHLSRLAVPWGRLKEELARASTK
jgi:hypothetical protein